MPKITLYTTNYCPYCHSAKALLSEKGLSFTEIDLTDKPDELLALKERTGWRTVPQIFFDDKLIGGFSELSQLDLSTLG